MNQTSPSANAASEDQDRLDQTMFYLNEAQAQAFCNLLDASESEVQSNPGLDHLMAITPPWAARPF